jgi:deazaflavin-dependent oxidoreductase (nitroreductase family)
MQAEKQVVIMAQQVTKSSTTPAMVPSAAYRRSSWIMLHVVNPFTRLAVGRLGLDDHNGTRVLEVKGRISGHWNATPVRVLEQNGRHYLVAPQGETNWVKNLRAQGAGRLRLGKSVQEFRAEELTGDEKLPVLRAYFTRWWSLVSGMTPVTSPRVSDEELMKAAPLHPAFVLV